MRRLVVELSGQSLRELVEAMRRRQLSPVEVTDDCAARIREHRELRAFITEPGSETRRETRRVEQRLVRKVTDSLLGAPVAVKDLFQTRGVRTTAGSRILRSWVPDADAAVIGRLRAAGAIIFGKTNLHEFAYGVTTANPWWGIARNPHDPGRSPGGSSRARLAARGAGRPGHRDSRVRLDRGDPTGHAAGRGDGHPRSLVSSTATRLRTGRTGPLAAWRAGERERLPSGAADARADPRGAEAGVRQGRRPALAHHPDRRTRDRNADGAMVPSDRAGRRGTRAADRAIQPDRRSGVIRSWPARF